MVMHIIVIKRIHETKFNFSKFETIFDVSLKNKYLTKYMTTCTYKEAMQILALIVSGSTAEVISRWSNLLTVQ